MNNHAISFQRCLKSFTDDQDKAVSPAETLARFYQQVDRLGLRILSEVRRIDNGRLGIPVFFSVCGDDASALTGTRKQMGKGASPAQAEASACMELAERFSLFSFIQEESNFIRGDYASLRAAGYPLVEPEVLLQAVHDQHMAPEILESLLAGLPLRWVWATSLGRRQQVLAPFSWFFAINEFNGSSAGNTTEEAALQGICEVVERHVCSLIHHGQLAVPRIDPASLTDPVAVQLVERFTACGIDLTLYDFSLDTGICTVGAVAIDPATFPVSSEIVFTAGTAPNPQKALIRAVTEVAQLAGDFNTSANYVASGLPKPQSMADLAYLDAEAQQIAIGDLPDLAHPDIAEEIAAVLTRLAEQGREVLMRDVRHPQLQIPAMYTIIPGTHFRERSRGGDAGLFAAKLAVELLDDPGGLEEKLAQMEQLLPGRYYLHFYRGKNLAEQGQAEAALVHFQQALSRPADADDLATLYSYAGSCLKDLGRYQEALGLLERGLAVDAERPDIHNSLGVCLYKLERYQEAIAHFQQAVRYNPASAIDYANIGINYSRLGAVSEAVTHLQLALSLDASLDFAATELQRLLEK